MSLADRKSAWIQSMGNPVTIFRSSGNLSTFGRFVKGRQLLSPYEINFVRFMEFPVNSGIQRGDLIEDTALGYQAFVVATQDHPQFGANTAIYTELYLVNYPTVAMQRIQSPQFDTNGNAISGTGGWQTLATVPMNVRHVNGNVQYKNELLLADTVFRVIMQISTPLQVVPTPDRIIIDGTNYQVSDINQSISPGLQVVQVKTDTRQ